MKFSQTSRSAGEMVFPAFGSIVSKPNRFITALIFLLLATACSTPAPFHHEYAAGFYSSTIISCVPYAREASGIQLSGDAYTWWAGAKGHYRRGHKPQGGAVLVLKHTSRMTSGHVAVVRKVIGPREIDVTHSNWGSDRKSRHIVYDSMRVQDVSPNNDWTQVRFWNDDKNVFGFPYASYGFIYP